MKMDIEGSEVEVLPDLIYEKSFQNIDGVMIEFHAAIGKDSKRQEATATLQTLTQNYMKFNNLMNDHKFEIIDLDDESYYLKNYLLPNCSIS